jgi:L-serine dehydratase
MRRGYYSVGGGQVVSEAELNVGSKGSEGQPNVPYPFAHAADLLAMTRRDGLAIAELMRANERMLRSDREIDRGLETLVESMMACIARGLEQQGELPGGLRVRRRAKGIFEQLERSGRNAIDPLTVNDRLTVYAIAVNEENAAGGRVVTAPTNGAAGVIPAVLRYWREYGVAADAASCGNFLLTAAAIGGLIKQNASIAGAAVGCQGEVGSAAAMAAAGLCAVMGGTPEQVENAAEIALEHHLGMTCDPVRGLVQIPCIERNAFGAVKAVTAASLALKGDGAHKVSLDACIETMRQTGRDMHERYKETSLGGLAVNVVEC